MSDHAKLAPSASKRWIECPGSVAAHARYPDETSEAAAEGTFGHAVAAICLEEVYDAATFLKANPGYTREVEGFTFTLDAEMCEHLEDYLGVCDALIESSDFHSVESRVDILDDSHGTSDFTSWNGDTMHVVDLKLGRGILVEAEKNTQGMCYALGALRSYPKRAKAIKDIFIHIVQPRHHRGGHSVYAISREELEAWGRDVLAPAAKRTRDADAPFAPGDWCRFCNHKPDCEALKAKSLKACQDIFAGDPSDLALKAEPPTPGDLTPEEVAKALAVFPAVEAWMKALRERAYVLANAGKEVSGFKLVRKTGNRAWKDEAQMLWMCTLYGIDPYAPRKIITPAVADTLLKAKRKAAFAGLSRKPDLGTALVPLSDKRKPDRPAIDVFDDLPSS